MAVVAACSAKGAPGVTTTALLLAALWPRPVLLVDADPAGVDVALRLPSPQGRPIDGSRGLLTLLPLARRALPGQVLLEHAQTVVGGIPVIAGLSGPEQAAAVRPLWNTLARAFAAAPADVVVDAGRVASPSVHLPLLRLSDVVVSVLHPGIAGVVHTREQPRSLGPQLHRGDGTFPRIGVVAVHDVGRPADVVEAAETIGAELPYVELFGQLALDPAGAAVFDGVLRSRPERTMLVRSGRSLIAALLVSPA